MRASRYLFGGSPSLVWFLRGRASPSSRFPIHYRAADEAVAGQPLSGHFGKVHSLNKDIFGALGHRPGPRTFVRVDGVHVCYRLSSMLSLSLTESLPSCKLRGLRSGVDERAGLSPDRNQKVGGGVSTADGS
jgi:hypothetical protein